MLRWSSSFYRERYQQNWLVDQYQERGIHAPFISPELAGNKQMRRMFKDPKINQRITAVVIDEAHLVYHWGDAFWPQYAQIG